MIPSNNIKSEREKMISGERYKFHDEELEKDRKNATRLYRLFNKCEDTEEGVKIIKELFGTTGETVIVQEGLKVSYGKNIHVGDKFFLNHNCTLIDDAPIRIGYGAMIGPNSQFYTSTHSFDPKQRIGGSDEPFAKEINIGDDLWAGGNSIILPGVTLGNNVIIGAGSVVTKSWGDNVIIAGNPAKLIRMNIPTK